jgi:hypothetical protein
MTTRRRVTPGPRRRAVLAWPVWCGAALALPALAGCADTVPAGDSRAAGRDTALRARAAADSVALLARYDATAAAHPPLAGRLAPLRAQVALHAEAFQPGPGPTAAKSPSASASRSAPPAVPGDTGAALKALATAETTTARARAAALRDASPELARLLASVAACGSAHALLLAGGAS